MPTIIKETGAGSSDANSYASRSDGNAYADSRLHSTAWTGASDDDKDRALIQATRTIDQEFQFNGYKANQSQALAWPRIECPDPDQPGYSSHLALRFIPGAYVDPTIVPVDVVNATCELAIALLAGDRTGDAQGDGIKRIDIAGALEVEFSGQSAPLVVTRDVIHALAKYAQPIGAGSGSVKLART